MTTVVLTTEALDEKQRTLPNPKLEREAAEEVEHKSHTRAVVRDSSDNTGQQPEMEEQSDYMTFANFLGGVVRNVIPPYTIYIGMR